jgi:hypothetical protein
MPGHIPDEGLHQEGSALVQVASDRPEGHHLILLREQAEEGVEDDVDQPEPAPNVEVAENPRS